MMVRPAEESDAPAIAAIYAPYVRDTAVSFEMEAPTADMMRRRMAATLETHPWLVAEHGGETVGFAYAGRHRERAAYRWSVDVTVYVNGAMRHSGIGRALYGALLEVLRRQGFRSAFAEIVLPNPGSCAFMRQPGSSRSASTRTSVSSMTVGTTSPISVLVWPKGLRPTANPYRLPSFEKRPRSWARLAGPGNPDRPKPARRAVANRRVRTPMEIARGVATSFASRRAGNFALI
jgi:L-amino acid N-acyltransferase YncA